MNNQTNGLRLIITIVERKQGKKVVKLFEKLGCTSHQTFLGKGTAPVEVFELLGFGGVDKDVVVSIADVALTPKLFNALETQMHFNEPGHGIAVSIEVCSVGGARALEEILGIYVKE